MISATLVILLLAYYAAVQLRTWRTSVTLWEHAVSVSPESFFAHRALASALVKTGQYERALTHYETALSVNPYDVDTINPFARFLATCADSRLRDYERAIFTARWGCELTRREDPKCLRSLAIAYNNLAGDLATRNEWAQAVDYYKRAIETDPSYGSPLFNLALLHASCSDPAFFQPEQAIVLAERAREITERLKANNLMIMAVVYSAAGRHDRAIESTMEAIRLAEADGNSELADQLRLRLDLLLGQPL
jgi:tetratricopeptide (TPR) repeat protein